jgi:hypothetical protein
MFWTLGGQLVTIRNTLRFLTASLYLGFVRPLYVGLVYNREHNM